MKVVINSCYGGFGLSTEAVLYLLDKQSELVNKFTFADWEVDDDMLTSSRMKPVGRGEMVTDMTDVIYDPVSQMIYTVDIDAMGKLSESAAEDYNTLQMRMRTHPDLIEVVEHFGAAANGRYSDLKVVDIDDPSVTINDVYIGEYDGVECVHEKHRTWG